MDAKKESSSNVTSAPQVDDKQTDCSNGECKRDRAKSSKGKEYSIDEKDALRAWIICPTAWAARTSCL